MSNPLYELHQQAQAEFISYREIPIVNTFGEPQAEYAAIRKATGMMDLPQRGMLELTGPDRLQFLNNLISAQTWDPQTGQALTPGKWLYSFLLNIRGRIVADMNVLEVGDRTILEVDRALAEPLREVLEAYHFAEKVKIENCSPNVHEIALHGPGAPQVFHAIAASDGAAAVQQCKVIGYDVVAWRDDVTVTPGIHLILPAEAARQIWMHLITGFGEPDKTGKRQLRALGWGAFNAARIEAGRALLGIDFEAAPVASAMPGKRLPAGAGDLGAPREPEQPVAPGSAGASPSRELSPAQGMLPAETGLMDRAVSLSKCYIGQEIVARMHARKQVARKIVGIRMENDALPLAGTQVLDDSGNPVGVITSSTNSPILSNRAICLGIVKKPLFEEGTRLRVAADGALRQAEIVPTPFVGGT